MSTVRRIFRQFENCHDAQAPFCHPHHDDANQNACSEERLTFTPSTDPMNKQNLIAPCPDRELDDPSQDQCLDSTSSEARDITRQD